jgi:hypothetical protein
MGFYAWIWTDRNNPNISCKILKNRSHSFIGHIIKHNEFVVNNLERTWNKKLKASHQKHRSWQLYTNENNGLQQFHMDSYLPIEIFNDTKKK